jgi:hypothetical protein
MDLILWWLVRESSSPPLFHSLCLRFRRSLVNSFRCYSLIFYSLNSLPHTHTHIHCWSQSESRSIWNKRWWMFNEATNYFHAPNITTVTNLQIRQSSSSSSSERTKEWDLFEGKLKSDEQAVHGITITHYNEFVCLTRSLIFVVRIRAN